MDARPVSVEDLLAQLGWLRRLALSLSCDEAEADDLVQDVWQTASAQRAAPSHLRAWLRAVLVNRWRMNRRGAARRTFYEQGAKRETEAVGPEQALERAQLQQRLAERVLRLEEPARAIVLLRYYEECSSSVIASRLGMPAATVRWHLARALDRLRKELDANEGGRARWVLLLVPRPE